jgi:RNA polymerase sigma-70 factor (ECF subfamily)
MNEDTLIRQLLSKNRQAAREFYKNYTPRLLNYIRQKIDREEDVEEITQDTLFAFLESLRDFAGRSKLNTYLCAIANNKIADFYRKKKLKKIFFSQLPPALESLLTDGVDPQSILDEKLLQHKIEEVFAKIPPKYARIIRLKYIEGRSVAEIAEILACSFKSAESVLFRARQTFVQVYTYG